MSEIRFRAFGGAILVMVAAMTVAPLQAGTVPVTPDAATFETPLNLDAELAPELGEAPLAAEVLSPVDSIGRESDAAVSPVLTSQGNSDVLLLLGNYPGTEAAPWSQGFEGQVGGGAPAQAVGQSDGMSLSPVPEQVLIPLPSAAWTGLTSLACLGLMGMMKHVRRFLR